AAPPREGVPGRGAWAPRPRRKRARAPGQPSGPMAGTFGGGQLAVDEYGNPFIIMEEQAKKKRLTGIDAHKANILAAKAIAETVRTSMGPKGMDKCVVSGDGDVLVTNDGATILEKMDVSHHVAKLLVELSKSQDAEIGDGTTGIVVMAGAMLEQAMDLIEKGIHPLRIAHGYEKACEVAVQRVQAIAKVIDLQADEQAALCKAACTALGSKVVSGRKDGRAVMLAGFVAVSEADEPRRCTSSAVSWQVAEEAALMQLPRRSGRAAGAGGGGNASSCAEENEPADKVPCCRGCRMGIGKPGMEEAGFFCHRGDGFRGPAYIWAACEDLNETYFGQTCGQWGSSTCAVSAGMNAVCPVTCGHCTQGEMHWSSKAAWRALYPQK
ncbi:unnamed protein product, partial [Prorocentrum cordatum]